VVSVDDDGDGNARRDLSDRYQAMLELQFTALANFEDKAWRTVRATVGLIGVYLTGISLLVEFGGSGVQVGAVDVLPPLVGSVALMGSIYYAILVLGSKEVAFGPSTGLSDKLTEGNLGESSYEGLVLQGYTNAIGENWTALGGKSENLSKSLALLFFGLAQVVLGLLFILSPGLDTSGSQVPDAMPAIVKFLFFIVVTIAAGTVSNGMLGSEDQS
jgi:hypothetical protein